MLNTEAAGVSRVVQSNQVGVHEHLHKLVERYRTSTFSRPISSHTQQAFEHIHAWLVSTNNQLILDACCGVGESTAKLSKCYANAKILGVDKSEKRLDKHHAYTHKQQNYTVLRADLNDFWRLLVQHKIRFEKQYLLYPNPYPKSSQIQKRWYASAITPFLMASSDVIEVRSNWRLYLEEFLVVAGYYGFVGHITQMPVTCEPFTPFERKYLQSGQACFKLLIEKNHV